MTEAFCTFISIGSEEYDEQGSQGDDGRKVELAVGKAIQMEEFDDVPELVQVKAFGKGCGRKGNASGKQSAEYGKGLGHGLGPEKKRRRSCNSRR